MAELRRQLSAMTAELERVRGGASTSLDQRIAEWRTSESAKADADAAPAGSGEQLNNRFAAAAGTFTYKYGGVTEFFAGLEGLVGLPVTEFMVGMTLEHLSRIIFSAWNSDVLRETTPLDEWIYVAEKPVGFLPDRSADATGRGGADATGRSGWLLADFAKQTHVLEARLLLAEVAAIRLYTGPM